MAPRQSIWRRERRIRASNSHPRLRLAEGRAPQDVPREPSDVVVLSTVLEHVDRREELLRELREPTEAGRFLVRVPMEDRHWLVPFRRELGLAHFSDPTHYVEYTRESFESELARASLTVTHAQVRWGEIWAEAVPA